MLRVHLCFAALLPCVLSQVGYRDPNGAPYNGGYTPTQMGDDLIIRFRGSEMRDPSSCEPYEEMYLDEDDCNIYCMVNTKIGNVVIRDRARRRLQTCLPSTMPCGMCRRRAFVTGLPQSMNATVPGKCLDDCRCAAQALSAGVLNEMAVQCQAVKSVKFQPYRKQVQSPQIDGFEISIPSPERRDRSRCEPYETSTYNMLVGSQEVYDLQCRTLCVVTGTIGLLQIKTQPRHLGAAQGNQCRQPTGATLYNGVEVVGSQEQLVGFCNRGTCSQLTRSNLRPRSLSSNDRLATGAFNKDTRGPLNVTELNESASPSPHHGVAQ